MNLALEPLVDLCLVPQDPFDHPNLTDSVVNVDQDSGFPLRVSVKLVGVLADGSHSRLQFVEALRDLEVLCCDSTRSQQTASGALKLFDRRCGYRLE